MKKMKLFLTGMLAACVAVGGVNAAEQTFEDCVRDTTSAVCELTEDVTLTKHLMITVDKTLKLNGHKLSAGANVGVIYAKDGSHVIIDGGNGTIDYSDFTLNATRIFVFEKSSLDIDNVTINAVEKNSDNLNPGLFGVDAGVSTIPATLKIGENTVINSTDSIIGIDTPGFTSQVGGHANVTIAGKLTSAGNAVTINGNVKECGTPVNVVVEGTAELTSTDGAGVYAAGYGVWTFEDGAKVTGKDAISIKSGTVTINGGEYTATGAFVASPSANGNGAELTGAAVAVTTNNSYAGNVILTINNGKFVAAEGCAVYEVTNESASALREITIADGEFIAGSKVGNIIKLQKAGLTKFIQGGTYSGTKSGAALMGNYIDGDMEKVNGVYYVGDDTEAVHDVKVSLVQPDGQTVNVAGAYRVAAGNKISLTQLFGFDMTDYKDYTITYVVKDAKGNELGRLSASYLKGDDDVYAAAYDDEFAMIDGDVTVEIIFSKNGKVVAPDEPVIPDPDDDKPAESTPGTGSETEEKPEGNPNTLDSLPLYLIGGAVAVLGVAGLGYSIKKKFEN